MVLATNLGFPRIGSKRELKKALEDYWAGRSTQAELEAVGKRLRQQNWETQREFGLDHIPSNDFSFYDHVLDTAAMVGAVPERFQWSADHVDFDTYFSMARGASAPSAQAVNGRTGTPPGPMEMTKWFNTNYHYIVPEFKPNQKFQFASTKCIDEFLEAQKLGIITRPVLLGPVSFLELGKTTFDSRQYSQALDGILDVYCEVLSRLRAAGAQWVQLDEPCLATDTRPVALAAFKKTYERMAEVRGDMQILLASYFGLLGDNMKTAFSIDVDAVHVDLVSGIDELDAVLDALPDHFSLSAGVVDGHNIWRCNLTETVELLERIGDRIGPERLMVAPSCSLLHVPMDAELETSIDSEIRPWLSFAKQKLQEISLLTDGLCVGLREIEQALADSDAIVERRSNARKTNNPEVKRRLAEITDESCNRRSVYQYRRKLQQERFALPPLPTTTIGSFPQTSEVRIARKDLRAGRLTADQYDLQMRAAIQKSIALQEEMGMDVLVHGEPERNDMVQFFAEQLEGMTETEHGWVQSYGSRYVKPPIIFGDVVRKQPMTVDYAVFAQSKTTKPVKGMLTGPVTMLQWSFVRDDQPRSVTCLELALAIRDEVVDLEANNIGIIQIDEPAIREGLPLKKAEWDEYFSWAVKAFRIAASGVANETQIHTHMCYSEFSEIIDAVIALDADVISIEAARSSMDLLDTLKSNAYPNEIGPGVYDIHSPIVPSAEFMEELIRKALAVIPAERLWVNPDCGLKTRTWEEVVPSLKAMVRAASTVRKELTKVPVN